MERFPQGKSESRITVAVAEWKSIGMAGAFLDVQKNSAQNVAVESQTRFMNLYCVSVPRQNDRDSQTVAWIHRSKEARLFRAHQCFMEGFSKRSEDSAALRDSGRDDRTRGLPPPGPPRSTRSGPKGPAAARPSRSPSTSTRPTEVMTFVPVKGTVRIK